MGRGPSIEARKNASDAKRGKIFTKIAREIIVAAKGGPDINFNAKLRTVVIKARQAGMPLAIELAALPPMPMRMPGPPS